MSVMECMGCGKPVEVKQHRDGEKSPDDFFSIIRGVHCDECCEKEKHKLAAEDRARFEKRLVSIVGKKYINVSLENYRASTAQQREALSAAKAFSASPSGFLYLHGTTGIGKTHLAVGIYREQTRESASRVEFWRVPELLLHLRSQIQNDMTEEDAIEPLIKARLLILDDLGAEKITDWVRQAFYVVISQRELNELPTVITSNLSLGEIEAHIGDERITSRIGGAARIVRIDGVDERIAGRQKRRGGKK